LFAVLYFGHEVVYKTKFVKTAEADVNSGRKEIDERYFVDVKADYCVG